MLMTVEKVYEIEDDMTKANMTDLLHAPLEDESRLGVLTQEQLFCRRRHKERYSSSGPIPWRSILFLPSVAFPRRALFHSTRAKFHLVVPMATPNMQPRPSRPKSWPRTVSRLLCKHCISFLLWTLYGTTRNSRSAAV
jgi:hypothetical protein